MDRQHQQTTQKHQLIISPLTLIIIKKEHVLALSFLIILIFSFFVLEFSIGPFDPQTLTRFNIFSQTLPRNIRASQKDCDYSNGSWVRDESYKFGSYNEDCPFLDPGFQCLRCGRRDLEYLNWRWQPYGCDMPRFNASDILRRSRNGRIVFAGDSIGRNQWESFLCMLAQGVTNKSMVYEENGNPITKHKGFLSMRFHEYNLTVEYYRAPFLVVIGRPPKNSAADIKLTIKVDRMHMYSKRWVGANVLVFNGGHWWNEEKTKKMGVYFEAGGEVNKSMNVMEAFERSLHTWKSWSMKNLSPEKSHIFFRSFSPVHYRNGTWNDGGRCDVDSQPDTSYRMPGPEPEYNQLISNIIEQMKHGYGKVQLLNITHLSMYRFDGHPSIYREPGILIPAPQDCSHWCLPGVPDVWNEMLFESLLSSGFTTE